MMVVMISGTALASERSLKEQRKWNVKMKVEMSIFAKWGGVLPFCKNVHLLCHSHVNSRFHFQK